jgi:hypothetical protein
MMTELLIKLPDQLAQEALRAGLLSETGIERIVIAALRTDRIDRMSQAFDILEANPIPAMSPDEIQAEIDAYRAEIHSATRS